MRQLSTTDPTDSRAYAVAELVDVLAFGEDSAALTFEHMAKRCSGAALHIALKGIAADESRHQLWLARLQQSLPSLTPDPAYAKQLRRSFYRLAHEDLQVHFARIFALDSAVCQPRATLQSPFSDDRSNERTKPLENIMMRKITQRLSLLIAASCFLAACATPPAKISQEKPVEEINNQHGLALRGYDPVAYFTDKKPVAGTPDITYQWKGATYQFATVQHRELFQSDPPHYAPQFGGYCAYAVSLGTTADGDPFQWAVDGDRLFVNANAIAYTLWNKSRSNSIRKGETNWPLIPKEPVASDSARTTSAGGTAITH